MDINEKFIRALELQEQGTDRREIYKLLGYQSIDALTKMMRKFGYRYDRKQEKYMKVTEGGQQSSDCEEIAVSMEQVKPRKKKNTSVQNDGVIDLKNNILKENILGLANYYDEIMRLLTWYKAYGGQMPSNEPQVIEVVQQGIKIELPKSESTKTSIRVNKEVWEQFGQFAELHSEFVKGDLLAQALKEYMEKYK